MPDINIPKPADYETTKAAIYRIKRTYPFVNCRVCGRSLSGRAIFALSVGNCRNAVLLAGGVHGSEWLNIPVLLKFFEKVCESIRTKKDFCGTSFFNLMSYRGIILVPCVNPDGTETAIHGISGAGSYSEDVRRICDGLTSEWNANARGVDINHNFNAGWNELRQSEIEAGILSPASRRYGGEKPESEPETVALANLCRRVQPRTALVFHSQGEEIFWRYGEAVPERSESIAKIFSAVSGYKLVDNCGLYAHGGFKDWFIKELRRPAFTIETGKGKNPLPADNFNYIYSSVEELLVLSAIL